MPRKVISHLYSPSSVVTTGEIVSLASLHIMRSIVRSFIHSFISYPTPHSFMNSKLTVLTIPAKYSFIFFLQ